MIKKLKLLKLSSKKLHVDEQFHIDYKSYDVYKFKSALSTVELKFPVNTIDATYDPINKQWYWVLQVCVVDKIEEDNYVLLKTWDELVNQYGLKDTTNIIDERHYRINLPASLTKEQYHLIMKDGLFQTVYKLHDNNTIQLCGAGGLSEGMGFIISKECIRGVAR